MLIPRESSSIVTFHFRLQYWQTLDPASSSKTDGVLRGSQDIYIYNKLSIPKSSLTILTKKKYKEEVFISRENLQHELA